MKIYGDSRSGNCQKVAWTARLMGRPFDWIEVDVMSGATRTPEFLAMNPAGQVPTAVLDDGRTLAQSNAIILYLAEGSDLVPSDAYDRARMMEWLFWEQYSHEPYVAVVRFQVHFLGKAVADLEPRLVERARGALSRLDDALAAQPFLVGARPTLADLSLVAYTRLAYEGGFALTDYPHVQAWVARVEDALEIAPLAR